MRNGKYTLMALKKKPISKIIILWDKYLEVFFKIYKIIT
jgi:hypothetical protein